MFYRHCRKLAIVCGVSAFNLSDLTRPESTRFRTVLSGLMNFAKFRYVLTSCSGYWGPWTDLGM